MISCLGHTISAQGVFGQPRDLVTRSVERACRAARDLRPAQPVKLVLMSTVSVNSATEVRTPRRGRSSGRPSWTCCAAWCPYGAGQPPAADFLADVIGPADPHLQWVVVRPDTLLDGDITSYHLHEGLVRQPLPPR